MTRAAVADGLVSVASPDDCTDPCWALALVAGPYPGLVHPVHGQGWDFHWYRRDRDTKMWSHKPGTDPVTNLDESGKLIHDVAKADHGSYGFCGFFCLCPPPAPSGAGPASDSKSGIQVAPSTGSVKTIGRDSPMSIVAEALLFSGIKNPRAVVEGPEESEIRLRHKTASTANVAAEPPRSGLGYRGVLLILESDASGVPTHTLRARRGVIEEYRAGSRRTYADVAHLEDFARDLLGARLPAVKDALSLGSRVA